MADYTPYKVGDRVQHNGWPIGVSVHGRLSNKNAYATVVEVHPGNVIRIQYEDPAIEASWADATDSDGMLWGSNWVRRAPKPVDFSLPLQQRCGRPAEFVRIVDKDFIKVRVYLPSGPRELSYPPSGTYYKDIASDIDLVNA